MCPKLTGCWVLTTIVAASFVACSPEETGFPTETASAIQVLLDDYVEFSHVPGVAVTVIDPDGNEWESTAGVSSVQDGAPVDADSLFRVGSHTKLMVGVVMLKLVEEGRVDLDAPLTEYFPEYVNWRGVTVRMLLAMRSGIPDYLVISDITMNMLTQPDSTMTPKEIVDKVYDQPMMFEPDTYGFYSDTNTFIAALIVEKVTGRPLANAIRKYVTGPWGMSDTFLDVNNFRKSRLIHGYLDLTVAGNDLTIVDPGLLSFLPMAGDMLPKDMMVTHTLVDSTYLAHPSYAWAAGALVSTSHDLSHFVRALFNGEVLNDAELAEMKKLQTVRMLGYPTDYGVTTQSFTHELGTEYGHSGMSYGYRSATFHYPDTNWTYSMTCNTYPAPWMEFDTELSKILLDPSVGPADACTVSGKFDKNPEFPEIQAKFRGRVNTGDGEYEPTGFGTAVLVTGNAKESLITRETMFGRNIHVTTVDGGLVDIRYRGQAIDNSEAFWRDTHILVKKGDLQSIGNGKSISTYDVDAYIEDVWGTDDPDTYTKKCVVGVVNRQGPAKVGLCNHITVTDDALLRGWLTVPVTMKTADVQAWLTVNDRPACTCKNTDGTWSACAQ